MKDRIEEEDSEETRRVSADLRDFLIRQQEAITGEHSAMARWLTASLLVLNAGGLLAVFNAADRLQHLTIDAAPFLFGTLAALLVGVLIQWAGQATSQILGEVIGHTIVAAATGEMPDEAKGNIETFASRISAKGKWPVRIGWLSAFFFASGALMVGTDDRVDRTASGARCLAIQRDMLSAKPRRVDGPALFQALACRPQGEGSVYASK